MPYKVLTDQSDFYKEERNSYTKNEDNTFSEQKEKIRQEKKSSEFERFYSSSAYIVLGVSTDDDFKAIKKEYKKLVRLYHPDLHLENTELYTELTQNINSAYEKLEKIHNT